MSDSETTSPEITPVDQDGKPWYSATQRMTMPSRFGDIIRQTRTQLGIGIRKFADEVGVDRSYVSAIETGKKPPSDDFIARAAATLGFEAESLRIAAGRFPSDVRRIIEERPEEVVAVVRERLAHYDANTSARNQLALLDIATAPKTEDPPAIQMIKYMGSKREIISFVADGIRSVLPAGRTLLDLFAGTHSVGFALRGSHRVFATDIQEYSTAIGKALLGTSESLPTPEALWSLLEPHAQHNRAHLLEHLADAVEREEELLSADETQPEVLAQYAEFQHGWPHAGELVENGEDHPAPLFRKWLATRRDDHAAVPYSLFTSYFACAYFSIAQCIWIDSIRYAIEQAFTPADHRYWISLANLMHACSYCTPGPGHFAQFRALNGSAGSQDIIRYRNRSIRAYFREKYAEVRKLLTVPAAENRIWTADYRDVLIPEVLSQVDAVYADPPYSFVHYSRFYHVLETLVRYDYPDSEYFGRYRADRHQSDFCIRTKVATAFDDIARPVAAARLPLVISYSDTGMISLDDIVAICRNHYTKRGDIVSVRDLDYLHCTMGRRGDKTRKVTEHLVICEPA